MIISNYSVVGFSGSRHTPANLDPLFTAASFVSSNTSVLVGCANGVDKFFRAQFPTATVFSVATRQWGRGRGAYAARSIALVRSLSLQGGLFVSFPSDDPPSFLSPSHLPSSCFCGSGSGSWASLAFAIGLGIPSLVFLGAVIPPRSWGLTTTSQAGWWLFQPHSSQLSLL